MIQARASHAQRSAVAVQHLPLRTDAEHEAVLLLTAYAGVCVLIPIVLTAVLASAAVGVG